MTNFGKTIRLVCVSTYMYLLTSFPQMIEQIQPAADSSEQKVAGSNIILNSTSEFCRNLGEIPTYGLAGNREDDQADIVCRLLLFVTSFPFTA